MGTGDDLPNLMHGGLLRPRTREYSPVSSTNIGTILRTSYVELHYLGQYLTKIIYGGDILEGNLHLHKCTPRYLNLSLEMPLLRCPCFSELLLSLLAIRLALRSASG